MRYVFAKDDVTIRSQLEAGSLLLVFPPDEQPLAHAVVRGIMEILETRELEELASFLRTSHNKKEEN